MTNHYGGPCGHCGGTGVDTVPGSFITTHTKQNTTLKPQDSLTQQYPITQSPIIFDSALMEVYNTPILPNLDYYDMSLQDPVSGFLGDGVSMACAPLNSSGLFESIGEFQGQSFPGSEFLLFPDDYSLQYPVMPELELPSDLDTTWSSSPEQFLSPPEQAETPATAPPSDPAHLFKCTFCPTTFQTRPKLNVHVKKHTKPHKCPVPGCVYSAAEKKSLERHIVSRAKWDAEHAGVGLQGAVYRCRVAVAAACTYASSREDNRNRHEKKCPRRRGGHGAA